MSYYCENLNQSKNSIFSNNNNMNEPAGCSKSLDDRSSEEFPNFNEDNGGVDSENEDSDEIFINSLEDDDDVQLSSPNSNSHNSDVDQRWYAFRGRFVGIHNDNRPLDNQLGLPENQPPQQPQEEETDFLEMDFDGT